MPQFTVRLYSLLIVAGVSGWASGGAQAQSAKEVMLHSFGGPGDGSYPGSALINASGTLYGVTIEGPAKPNDGTLFSLTPDGSEAVSNKFTGSNGSGPQGSLLDVNGAFLGTTVGGGTYSDGTVYKRLTNGRIKILHSFAGSPSDGNGPTSALVEVNGVFYGTTSSGGEYNGGTVFSITASGSETILHSFGNATDGSNPYGDGLVYFGGALYGTTDSGGTAGEGAVFSMTLGGTETLLHSFGVSVADGVAPDGTLIAYKGTLYGTTVAGGAFNNYGIVYKITPSGVETVIHSFGQGEDGENPNGALLNVGGTFYGTTQSGGQNKGGAVYKISPSGNEKVLYSFLGGRTDGYDPEAGLVQLGGSLYGTTYFGGTYLSGTAFSITP